LFAFEKAKLKMFAIASNNVKQGATSFFATVVKIQLKIGITYYITKQLHDNI
jgi:hypothetical protein